MKPPVRVGDGGTRLSGMRQRMATACDKHEQARVAAAGNLAAECAAEGRVVDRARWLGMKKVRSVWKECGVALTGSGALGHAARLCLTSA